MITSITSLSSYKIFGPRAICSTSLTLNGHTFCEISGKYQLNYKRNKVWFLENVNDKILGEDFCPSNVSKHRHLCISIEFHSHSFVSCYL